MRRIRPKTAVLSQACLLPSLLKAFAALLVALLLLSATAPAAEIAACKSLDTLKSQKTAAESRLGSFPASDTVNRAAAEAQIAGINANIAEKELQCEKRQKDRANNERECTSRDAALWRWNPDSGELGECEDRRQAAKSNPNSGECNNAELFKGELRGQACKSAEQTIKDVRAQQEAVTTASTAAATAYSGFQASQASGQQADAQNRQTKILQALAISKIASGGLALSGAAQLHSAAGDAEGASSTISDAHKKIQETCTVQIRADEAARRRETSPIARRPLTEEQCFYSNAPRFGVQASQAEYATYERMKSGSSQSKEQADKARAQRNQSMVTGMADTIVGLQALYMSRQTANNGQGMGVMPTAPPIQAFNLGGGGTTGGSGMPQAPENYTPTDYGTAEGGGYALGSGGAGVRGSMRPGKGFGTPTTFRPEKSGISGGGGGGGRGGGGGGGGNGQSRGKGGSRGMTSTEYTNTGGGLRPAPAPTGGEKNDGANAFAEALSKLFPKDDTGKPVVDARELASGDEPVLDDAVTGSEVYAADLSIFEQVSSRYRQLTNEGRL